MNTRQKDFRKKVLTSVVFLFALVAVFTVIPVSSVAAQEAGSVEKVLTPEQAAVQRYGLIAAAIAFGFGAIGAGIAIANVGAAAMGAIGEKPEIASQALIFIALAEGLVVFGFITALMILGKI